MNPSCFFKRLAPLGLLVFAAALQASDVAMSDGQNAEDVVGQTDAGGAVVFNEGTPYDSQRLDGLSIPYDVAVDTASHRLFVVDYRSNRILVYDLNSSNALADLSPDHVLGQSGFYRDLSGASANALSNPVGIDFDPGSNRLFVADASNSRVLIFDVAAITDGENAVNVLGQTTFTGSSAATTISGMRTPQGCVYDGINQRLFVGDTYNHRVLVYDLAAITDGENAVNVLGQANFTNGTSATTINGLNYPRHLDYDRANARLFVADYNNSRVMVFDVAAITDGENAVNVLGQTTFTAGSGSTAINRLSSPFGVVYSPSTQRLYVGDSNNHRVLIYDVASITDGENAVNELGQSNFTNRTSGATQSGMDYPRGVALDDAGNRLFVVDQFNNRILMFDVTTNTIVNGQNAANVVGQTDGAGNGVYTTGSSYDGAVQKGMNRPYNVVVDTVSHRLFVADYQSDRVLVYALDVSNTLADKTADNVLGQSDFLKNFEPSLSQNSISAPSGLAFDSSRGYLYVASYGRNRVLVFDVNSITNGENAINVLGQSNFTTGSSAITASGLSSPWGLDYDGATQKLYVADRSNHRVLIYDLAAITDGENAVNVLGQPDFTTGAVATPPTAASLYYPSDVDVKGTRLYVADEYNNRIMVFDVASITNGQNAVNVLGQTTFTTRTSGTTAGTMASPRSVVADSAGNRLFAATFSSNRVMVFDVASITNGENAVNVLGQSNFTASSSSTSQSGLYSPWGLAYDSGMNRLYIADAYNNRVIVQSVGPVSPSTSTMTAMTGTATGKIDLSWGSAGDDGVFNNLTGYYRIQYATYTAVWSTSSTPTNAFTSTVTATNVVPGVVQSTTIAGLTPGTTYYFALFTGDEVPNWSSVSNTTSAVAQSGVTLSEAVGQPGWIGQGETQRVLGTAQVVSDNSAGVTVSSVAVQASGYTTDGNLTNVEVWVSSSGYIDANAIRLEGTAKPFSSNTAVFTQNVTVSTTPLYFIARSDVSGSATQGTVEIALRVYTTASTTNNPIAFSNSTDVVAPPGGSPSGLTATASNNLLRVSLSWSGATGADSYSIFRATYSGVTTTDFLLGISSTTSFNDDYIPPAQQLYYKVVATNRAGSTASSAANATSVDVPALTTNNIYLRAGTPSRFGAGNPSFRETLNGPSGTYVDNGGNVYIADSANNRVLFIPKKDGTYFGQSRVANYVYTLTGTGAGSYGGDGAAATAAQVNGPQSVSVDSSGNVFVADTANHRIRFIPKAGGTFFGQSMTANFIYTIAGNGTGSFGGDGGIATSAQIQNPSSVSVDAIGNVYLADSTNHRIRFISKVSGTYFGQSMTANCIYTVAGNGTGSFGGDGAVATVAQLFTPSGVGVDAGGNIYIADKSNHRVRFVARTSGTYFGQAMTANFIYTIAGNGTGAFGGDGGAATSAQLQNPYGVSIDSDGNVYIADLDNNRIRFVSKISGTYFGSARSANNIYTIGGNGTATAWWQDTYGGSDGVAATAAPITTPCGVGVDGGGNLYVADTGHNRVRFIPKSTSTQFGQSVTANYIYTIAGGGVGSYLGDNGLSTNANFNELHRLGVDASGNIYFADRMNQRIRFVPKISGTYFGRSMVANFIYTIAGGGGSLADGVNSTSASFSFPYSANLDSSGNIYIADRNHHVVRFIPITNGTYFGRSMTANCIYTIAGTMTSGYSNTFAGDGGPATASQLNGPLNVGVDCSGNVGISDNLNHRIRFIPKTDGTYFGQSMTANYIYTVAGNGTNAFGGDGAAATAAQLNSPTGVNFDSLGNIYIADCYNQRIRFIPKTGGTYFGQSMTASCIYTIAGGGGALGDGGSATSGALSYPEDISVDAGGNIFIADLGNNRVRFIPKKNGTFFGQAGTANYIYTIGGTGNTAYSGENASATGKSIQGPGGLSVAPDHMVYLTDTNNKIRMIAGEDFIAPSTSTLAVTTGVEQATLSWNSAGDDNVNLGNLTGTYRIQFATYTASWSTASTPANATTVTISTTNVVPGSAQSYTATGLTAGLTYYFVLWSGDEVPNWSDISNATSTIPLAPIRSVTITYGNTQAFGVGMMGTNLVGSTGTIVTNDGTLASTYALRASTITAGSPWQVAASTPAGPDKLVVYGVFHGAAPQETDFGLEDVIGPANQSCSGTAYTVSGSTTGVAVPAGQDRTLWIRMDMPTTTTTMAPQSMRVEITADPP